jgi:hypothetical protein
MVFVWDSSSNRGVVLVLAWATNGPSSNGGDSMAWRGFSDVFTTGHYFKIIQIELGIAKNDCVRYRTDVRTSRIMARALLRLEDDTFAAWACGECAWIVPGGRESGKPLLAVKEGFDKHECAKYPRFSRAQAELKPTSRRRTQP